MALHGTFDGDNSEYHPCSLGTASCRFLDRLGDASRKVPASPGACEAAKTLRLGLIAREHHKVLGHRGSLKDAASHYRGLS